MQHIKVTTLTLDKAIELGYEPKEGDLCLRVFDATKTPNIIKEFKHKTGTDADRVTVEDTITKRGRECSTNAIYKKFKVVTELTPEL